MASARAARGAPHARCGGGRGAWEADLASLPPAEAAAALARLKQAAHEVSSVRLLGGGGGGDGGPNSSSGGRPAHDRGAGPPRRAGRSRRGAEPPAAKAAAPPPPPAELCARAAEALEAVLSAGSVEALHLGLALPRACLARVAAALAANRSLLELSVTGACGGDAAVLALHEAISSHPRLRCLDAACCGLTDVGADALARTLAARAGRRAELAWRQGLRGGGGGGGAGGVGSGGDGAAEGGVPRPPSDRPHCLRVLRLSGNGITDAGAARLAAALRDDWGIGGGGGRGGGGGGGGGGRGGLEVLELRGCRLTQHAAEAFRAALAEAPAGPEGPPAVDLRGNGHGRCRGCAACGTGAARAGDGVLWAPCSGAAPAKRWPAASRRPAAPAEGPALGAAAAAGELPRRGRRGGDQVGPAWGAPAPAPLPRQLDPAAGRRAARRDAQRGPDQAAAAAAAAAARKPPAPSRPKSGGRGGGQVAGATSLEALEKAFRAAASIVDDLEARLLPLLPAPAPS
ncbi:hypothetical protein Rsub_06345 [Raphidocelis subcapitata]|uniref:Uncharacterized protein n=1 Tax=Raphidocelis subcapitata TaxID=307507 RepID=A0A2V0P6X8_9CHLO|nr:hypothetical protein Rsub_06345 [Raphidocelis subcapitata]|eukprot:GBF93623.1 hypothetical protein Rsub_06345 [Raphidocelis subcapitata]